MDVNNSSGLFIPFNQPYVSQNARKYIDNALNSPVQQGDGKFSSMCTEFIEKKYMSYKCLLMPSCTSAIELSLLLLDLKSGDEIIMPSYNFTSAAAVAVKLGAKPVFVDVSTESGCIEVSQIASAITKHTKAILWVNYGGLGVDNSLLVSLSKKAKIPLIEDAAHNFGMYANGQKKFDSDFITFSFHATKNIQCGEGGALLVKNDKMFQRARVIREKGTNRHNFLRGEVSKYSWVDVGGSYLLAEINAALLMAQLEEFDWIQETRRRIVQRYQTEFTKEILGNWRQVQGTEQAAHIFALLAPEMLSRERFILSMNEAGIEVTSHYENLATSLASKNFRTRIINHTNAKSFSSRIVRFPVYPALSEEIEIVIRTAKNFFSRENE